MTVTNLQTLYDTRGARRTPEGLLLTFGDVPAEYAAGSEGCLLLDLTQHGRVRVTGSDRTEFLHRLLANRVRGLEPGQGVANLLLTSKGKIVQAFDLVCESDALVLDTWPAQAPKLIAALDMYLFTDDVQLHDESEDAAVLGLTGPTAAAVLCKLLPDLEDLSELPLQWVRTATFRGQELRIARRAVAGSAGFELDAGPQHAASLFEALIEAGARPGGQVACDILRIEAGQAEFTVDIDENIYPQEARREAAFSLEKGCYIGQEVVAKIDTYGGLNKCLAALHISHDDPVPRGTKLLAAGDDGAQREVGILTSWSYSFVLDSGLALGYVKRRHYQLGASFALEGVEGSATLVPMPVRQGGLPITGGLEQR